MRRLSVKISKSSLPSIQIAALYVSAGLSILLGGLIYILWRPDTLLMFRWFDACGFSPMVYNARQSVAHVEASLPSWTIYSLPHALWTYSFAAFLGALWGPVSKHTAYACITIVAALSLGGEFGQLLGVVPGYFEWNDIMACGTGLIAATLIIKTSMKE